MNLRSKLLSCCVPFLMALGTAVGSAAPSDAHLSFTREISVSSDHRQIRLVVLATGPDGHPLQGLSQQHFTVTVDDKPGQVMGISQVAANDQPLAVVLAMDVSKSMAGSAFRAARRAAGTPDRAARQ